jgi:hypothetical protein
VEARFAVQFDSGPAALLASVVHARLLNAAAKVLPHSLEVFPLPPVGRGFFLGVFPPTASHYRTLTLTLHFPPAQNGAPHVKTPVTAAAGAAGATTTEAATGAVRGACTTTFAQAFAARRSLSFANGLHPA